MKNLFVLAVIMIMIHLVGCSGTQPVPTTPDVVEKVTADGQIEGVCVGTSLAYDITYYVNRPQKLNAYHGYGPMLSAGAELIQLLKNFDVREENHLDHYWRK